MKQRIITTLLACTFLAASTAALADDHRNDHGRDNHGQMDHGHAPEHVSPRNYPDHPGPGADNRGGRPMHWNKGERVPVAYRSRQYVVSDWRGHRLSAPPRGYQWVGVGADYFLVGVATGIVMQSILGQ